MSDRRVIAVVGATGAQGGALVRAILNDPNGGFAARVLTRDVNGAKAKEFAKLGAEVVNADIDNPESSLGWVGAWTSRPSVYAVAAETTADVVAAVNFARQNNLRLVVKGGGHSYQGTSNAADSLLIWTRKMNAITLDDAFVGSGCRGQHAPQEAVTV